MGIATSATRFAEQQIRTSQNLCPERGDNASHQVVKRCFVELAVFLMLGAIVTVAVAFGLASRATGMPRAWRLRGPPTAQELRWFQQRGWPTSPTVHFWVTREPTPYVQPFGLSQRSYAGCDRVAFDRYLSMKEVELMYLCRWHDTSIPVSIDADLVEFATLTETGWPCRSVQVKACQSFEESQALVSLHYEAVAAGDQTSHRPSAVVHEILNPELSDSYRPMWAGFAADTAIFAFVFCSIWQITKLPSRIVGHIRAHRGRCTACGYDLRGHDINHRICPECGAGIRA